MIRLMLIAAAILVFFAMTYQPIEFAGLSPQEQADRPPR
jgi:hypothetical protein